MNPSALGGHNRTVVAGHGDMSRFAGASAVIFMTRPLVLGLGGDLELVPGDGDSHRHTRYPTHQPDLDAVAGRQASHDVEAQGGVESKSEDRRFGQEAVDLTHSDFGHADTVIGDGEEVSLRIEEPGYPNPVGGWRELGGVVEYLGQQVREVGNDTAGNLDRLEG
jgi:hypothetical protein